MSQRLIFIGLDGLGLDLAQSLAARGVMPYLGRLMELGATWSTDSPLPEVSPVCWTSLFSGAEPGEHGVYGFGEPQPGAYGVRPVQAEAVAVPRLWDDLSRLGRSSVVLNVPLTYPARAILGVMVSGFVAPELSRAVHPPALLPRVQALGYRPEADLEAGVGDPAALLTDLKQAIAARAALFRQFWQDPWDLYIAIFTDSDRVNHFLWPALWEPSHPLHAPALDLYRSMDGFLGELWQRFGEEVLTGRITLLIAADHAFGPIRSEVYLNPWLRQQGFLHVEGWQQGPGHERILPQSLALALDPGRVYLHWAERFPGGCLVPGPAAEEALDAIKEGLLSLRFRRVKRNGGQVRVVVEAPIARVHLGRELYHGPQASLAPDLVVEAAQGYPLRAGLGRASVFGLSHLTGTHCPRGAVACLLPGQPGPLPPRVSGLNALMRTALGLEPRQAWVDLG
ncbi:Alkaline phosphatase family protein [Desulfarculales bacterium]